MREEIKKAIRQAPKAVHPEGALKLVIFDCDGVLVESEHLVSQVIGEDVRKHGWNITDHKARELFSGVQLIDIQKEAQRHVTTPLPENWHHELHPRIIEVMKGDVQRIPGVETILQTLQDLKMPYRIGSNSSLQEMDIKFTQTDLHQWFKKHRIHSACEIERSKPFPDLYLHAAKQEGVDPENCIVIEDSDTGLKAGYDAGMACILLRDLNKPAPNYPGLIRVGSLDEATAFIKEVLNTQKQSKGTS